MSFSLLWHFHYVGVRCCIKHIVVSNSFAFVEFEDARDAEDAVKGLDGRTICGRRARVELSNGKSGRGFRGPPSRSRGRPFDPSDRWVFLEFVLTRKLNENQMHIHSTSRCYECGDRGHYARDCRTQGRSRRRWVHSLTEFFFTSFRNRFANWQETKIQWHCSWGLLAGRIFFLLGACDNADWIRIRIVKQFVESVNSGTKQLLNFQKIK